MTESPVRLHVRPDDVAVVTLDVPGRPVNVLTPAVWAALDDALTEAADGPGVRGLVVASGKPGVFVAGADLKWLAAVPGPNDPAVRDLAELGHRVLARLESLPFPTVAAVNGPALGGGLELALACDHVSAADAAAVSFGMPEVTLGLTPGWGGTQRLPRLIGLERACRMLLTGDPLSPREAMAAGLVREVVAAHDLLESACRLAAASVPDAVRGWKRGPVSEADRRAYRPPVPAEPAAAREVMLCVVRGAELPLPDALAVETAAFLRVVGSDESKRRIAAFFAGRKRG